MIRGMTDGIFITLLSVLLFGIGSMLLFIYCTHIKLNYRLGKLDKYNLTGAKLERELAYNDFNFYYIFTGVLSIILLVILI